MVSHGEGAVSAAKDKAGDALEGAQDFAERAERHPAAKWAARAGLVANALVHGIIGGIAIAIALGAGVTESADQGGAMRALRDTPLGAPALWFVGIALCLLAAQQVIAAIAESRAAQRQASAEDGDGLRGKAKQGAAWKDAVRPLGRAVAYAAVGITALATASGEEPDGEEATEELSGELMEHIFGLIALGIAGVVVAAVGIAFLVRGIRRSFLDEVRPPRRWRTLVGVVGAVGYVAKGIAVTIVGVLFVIGAVQVDPTETGGLDGALQSLTTVPGGVFVLMAVGVGVMLYALYCLARAAWEH